MRSPLLARLLFGLHLAVLPAQQTPTPSAAPVAQVSTVLELQIDTGADGATDVARKAKDLDAAIARCEGHLQTVRATAIDNPATTLRTTVWRSMEHAEDAALALDGQPAAAAFAAARDPARSQSVHFRGLRAYQYSDAPCGHLEVVVFRTRPGVTRAANLQKFDAAEPEFAKGQGLLGHSLWLAPDGRWAHVLHWSTAADYAKTGKALFTKPTVAGWIRSLDFQRFVVQRGDVVAR